MFDQIQPSRAYFYGAHQDTCYLPIIAKDILLSLVLANSRNLLNRMKLALLVEQ